MDKIKKYWKALALGMVSFTALAMNGPDRSLIPQNQTMSNPGFESGKVGWMATGGTFTIVSSAGNIIPPGRFAASWDSNLAGQTLVGGTLAITSGDGISGAALTGAAYFKCATGTCTHLVQLFGGTTLSTLAMVGSTTITSSTTGFVQTTVTGTAPTSGYMDLRVQSVASDEPLLYADNAYLGRTDGFTGSTALPTNLMYGPTTSTERIARARIGAPGGGSCAVTSESGDWINGTPTSSGTGICTIPINSEIFSGIPSCSITPLVPGVVSLCVIQGTPSATSIEYACFSDTGGTGVNIPTSVICMGPR